MNMKILAVVACIVLAVMMFSPVMPVNAVNPAIMNTLQYRYFNTDTALFSALQTADNLGGVDTMQYPITKAMYNSVLNNTNIVVEPLSEAGEYEMAFNNNYTDGVTLATPGAIVNTMDRRSPMNYTDFRNAMNCLVDKQGVIHASTLGGFATQSDTQVPTPLMAAYVNNAVTGANNPWQFNVTNALAILYRGGWYNTTYYPSFPSLLSAYGNGFLGGNLTGGGKIGNQYTACYPANDIYGQWGGGDPKATADANKGPLAPLMGFVRTTDARKDIGDFFITELNATGIPYVENYEPNIGAIRPYVLAAQTYDFATLGYSFGSPPNWWYSELTPAGIYANGPNPYLVQDSNTTKYATAAFTDPDQTSFMADQLVVQYNLVWESYFVPVYCPATYCAYKTGLLGQIDILGQGTEANGAQWENWITLRSQKTTPLGNTVVWNGVPPEPASNILYMGLANPPDMLNPIFQDTVYDFQVTDEIFTYPIGANPYTILPGSAITNASAGGDLPWMAYAWNTSLIPNPGGVDGIRYPGQWTNVTLWLRNDIKWHDGVPFTDADINYTIYINAVYGDAYVNAAMVWAVNNTGQYGNDTGATFAPYFQKDITAQDPTGSYTCSIQVKSASWLNLYLPLYQEVPEHLYKYIVPNSITAAEAGLDVASLHGLWPGQAANASNFLTVPNGAPGDAPYITFNNVSSQGSNGVPDYTLIGTGPWAYRTGSTSPASFALGGGITLDAYSQFFMPIAPGAIALQYTWLGSNLPSDQPEGGYFRVGLTDLVLLANSYNKAGTPPSSVPISGVPGNPGSWNPGADLAGPSGGVTLTDLVQLATHWGWYFGNYSYNAPYPPSEVANGGPR